MCFPLIFDCVVKVNNLKLTETLATGNHSGTHYIYDISFVLQREKIFMSMQILIVFVCIKTFLFKNYKHYLVIKNSKMEN